MYASLSRLSNWSTSSPCFTRHHKSRVTRCNGFSGGLPNECPVKWKKCLCSPTGVVVVMKMKKWSHSTTVDIHRHETQHLLGTTDSGCPGLCWRPVQPLWQPVPAADIQVTQALFLCTPFFSPNGKGSHFLKLTHTLWQVPQDVSNIH